MQQPNKNKIELELSSLVSAEVVTKNKSAGTKTRKIIYPHWKKLLHALKQKWSMSCGKNRKLPTAHALWRGWERGKRLYWHTVSTTSWQKRAQR